MGLRTRAIALGLIAGCGRVDFDPRPPTDGSIDAGASIRLVAHTIKNADTTNLVTDPIDTTGASLIIVAMCDYETGPLALPMDSAGNTWVALSSYGGNTNPNNQRVFYAISPATSASHTFTNPGTDYLATAVLAFTGISAFDSEAGNNGGAPLTLAFTPSHPGELVVSFASSGQSLATAVTIGDGFDLVDDIANNFATAPEDIASAFLVTGSPVFPTWTFTNDTQLVAAFAGFLP